MSFDLTAVALLGAAGLLYGFIPARWRGWVLLLGSIAAIYVLQPAALPIRFSAYIFPTAAVALSVLGWWFTRAPQQPVTREDRLTLFIIAALVIGLSLLRFLPAEWRIIARPPDPLAVIIVLFALAVFALVIRHIAALQNHSAGLFILLIVLLFVALKTEPFAVEISRLWRSAAGQDTALASMADLNWLGFSYLAFRLIHTLRDRQTGLLPVLSLREYVTYMVFAPAFTAGPIDRAERFTADLRTENLSGDSLSETPETPDAPFLRVWGKGGGGIGVELGVRINQALPRLALGLLKKFVIADTLAAGLALTPNLVEQSTSTFYLWLLLYGYALRLFFDFSGYSDIAIGLGILFGISLPENFNRPYFKTNLTAFWQSWHMTLSSWARFYVFTPFSRALLRRKLTPAVVVLLAHVATMTVVGLWHGVTVNFFIWGLWHAAGLFLHKQWADRTRAWYRGLEGKRKKAWAIFGWFITFHYITLGWVWFALPGTALALRTFARLLGLP